MTAIRQFTEIGKGIVEADKNLATLNLTVDSLEALLEKPEYSTGDVIQIEGKANRKAESAVEKVTGFGQEFASVFESLTEQFGRIPTLQEFNDASMVIVKQFWIKEKPEGIVWSEAVAQGATNRNRRTYMAQINELHCVLLIKELFPDWTVSTSEDLDVLMGVDIVVETDKKRLYFHLFKNSRYGFLAFRKKEKRGGRKNRNKKFIKYNRDFSGDKTLMYEGRTNVLSGTTKFINGIPLFEREWLESQLLMFNKFKQHGEPLSETGKLQYLEDFLLNLKPQEVAV